MVPFPPSALSKQERDTLIAHALDGALSPPSLLQLSLTPPLAPSLEPPLTAAPAAGSRTPSPARAGSYSPYSKFRVGACLLAEDGTFVKGANVECASYGGAICAERTAIVKGVSEGKRKYKGLAVTSDVNAVISPCGICRQVLREFCPLNMPILLIPSSYDPSSPSSTRVLTAPEAEGKDTTGALVETTMGEILPLSFGPEDLDKPRDPPASSSSAAVAGGPHGA
ncbi:hypothetical protein JCM6882_000464 [Rhodosporidiobolus microsporus]